MTDNELNALVAERVMGCDTIAPHHRDKRAACHCSGLPHGMDTDGHIPDYANDIAAAFQVAEKHPHFFSLIRSNDNGRFGFKAESTWKCRFYAPEKFEAEADTPSRAICLAALDAAGVTVEVRAGINMTWDISEKDHDELRSMFGVEAEA